MKKTQENLSQETDVNVTMPTKSKQKQLEKDMMSELRKQGINPDLISEYGDIDFEDGIDDNLTYNDNFDEYGDDSYEY
jgi:hypothetical protein